MRNIQDSVRFLELYRSRLGLNDCPLSETDEPEHSKDRIDQIRIEQPDEPLGVTNLDGHF